MSEQTDNIFHDVLKNTFEEYGLLFSKEATVDYKNAMIQGVLEVSKEDPKTARVFIFILPLAHILSQLFTHNRIVFNKVVSWVKKKNLFSFVPRLKKDVIYDTLLSLDVNISKSILGKLNCDENTYHDLCENLQNKTAFLTLIGQCNTSGISHYLWTTYYPIVVKNIVSTWSNGNTEENGVLDIFSIMNDELQNVNDDEFAEGYKIGTSVDVTNDAVFELLYTGCFWWYLELVKKIDLDGQTASELKSVFVQPAFEKQYEETSQLYKDGKLIQHIRQLAEPYPWLRDAFETATDDVSTIERKEEPQTSKIPAEIEAQKDALRKKKEAEAFNLIRDLLINTAGEKDFFKEGFTLGQLIEFFEKILTVDSVLDAVTKTNNKTKYVYKGIVLEKFCNIIGYLISKEVIIYPQKKAAEALFGMEETKTAILNWKPADKTSQEVFDREDNLFTTCCSYISHGFKDTPKSFIEPKIREWFDVTLDSVRKPQ